MTTYEELGSSNINGWNFTWPGGGAFDHSIMYTDMLPGDTANMSFSGTAKYTYKWLDGNGNPAANPPAKVYIKEWSFAEWCAIIGGYSLTPLSAAGQADGGLMDAYVGSSSEGPTFRGGQTTSYSTPHLVQVDGSSGTIERTVNVSANATASISQYSYGGNLSADFNYGVDIDTRGVTLTRDGAHGETIDSDGTVHGDTTFSYYDESWTSSGDYSVHHNNWQTFHPFFVGNWTRKWDPQQGDIEDVTWNWDPFATGDTQDTGNWSMLDGSRNHVSHENGDVGWEGPVDSPQTRAITYTAKDNGDGATAKAKYILTMHDPIEEKHRNPDTHYRSNNPTRPPGAPWL